MYKPADAKGRAQNVPVPVLPEAAKAETKEGLEAFARYYVELLEHAYLSGNTDALKGVSAESCTSCTGPIGDIEHAYSDGGWIVGGTLQMSAVSTSFLPSSTGSYFANLSITQNETAYYDGPDKIRSTVPAPGQDAPMQLTAAFVKGSWQIEDFSPPKGIG